MFLHHFGDSPGHRSLLGGEVQVEVESQLLLQEVHDELGAGDLLVVVLDPGHLPLRRQLPIKVVLRRDTAGCEKSVRVALFLTRRSPRSPGRADPASAGTSLSSGRRVTGWERRSLAWRTDGG